MSWIALLAALTLGVAPVSSVSLVSPGQPVGASPLWEPGASVVLKGRFLPVRQALRASNAEAAAAALRSTSATSAHVPGLFARTALLAGDEPAACAVDVTAAGPAGLLHRARCAWRQGGSRTALTAKATAVADLVLLSTEAPALLFFDDDAVAMTLAVAGWGSDGDRGRLLGAVLQRPVPSFDAPGRARQARVLQAIVDRPPSSPLAFRAAEVLVYEMPELARATDEAVLGASGLTNASRIRRATTLERLHKNDELVALIGDLVGKDCDAAILVGKAWRKTKKYAAARRALATVSPKRCSSEQQKKAQYLEVRLATVQKSPAADQLASAFADRWGNDPLVDDVLVWQGEGRAARSDVVGARAVLEVVVAEHPDGDMADEARFRLAMGLAEDGDVVRARAILDDGVDRLLAASPPRSALLDRARYWSGRLLAIPDPDQWTPTTVAADAIAGRDRLAALAGDRPASFYGRLASLVVLRLGGAIPRPFVGRASSLGSEASVAVPAALATLTPWRQARAAADAGFDDEAAVLLGEVGNGNFDVGVATAVAALFASVDRPDLAHRAMRQRGMALLPDAPVDDASVARWTLAWPLAHEEALTSAALAAQVPPPLLWGLAREESTFDESVVSWAGAVGLCQLMPPTARDEATSLKLPPPTVADLVDPVLNARLGASHLGRRLKGMGHPLQAIAAYNAGPGSVAKWMPPPGKRRPLDRWVEQIPFEETRNYVKKVTGSWVTYALLYGDADVVFPLEIGAR